METIRRRGGGEHPHGQGRNSRRISRHSFVTNAPSVSAQRCGECESIVSEKGRRNHLKRRSFLPPPQTPPPTSLATPHLELFLGCESPPTGLIESIVCCAEVRLAQHRSMGRRGRRPLREKGAVLRRDAVIARRSDGRTQFAPTVMIEFVGVMRGRLLYCMEMKIAEKADSTTKGHKKSEFCRQGGEFALAKSA